MNKMFAAVLMTIYFIRIVYFVIEAIIAVIYAVLNAQKQGS